MNSVRKMKNGARLGTGVYPKQQLNFQNVYADFLHSLSKDTGSATTFLGVARHESADGKKKIKYLVMETYEKHSNKVLKKICSETKRKYKLNHVVIIHALGKFKPGDPVVFVGVSSPRRDVSFKGLREAVERYKKEPALFKQEIYTNGTSKWIG